MVTELKRQTPFSVSPNPTSLYFTPSLEAAVFRIRWTVENRQGLSAILGDVGLGKSSLLRYLHAHFDAQEDTISILLPSPSFKTDFGLIQAISQLVGIPKRRSAAAQRASFEEWLGEQYRAGFNVVLLLDEAQKLKPEMLELMRDFLNFETNDAKLIQVVLSGQLELRDRLLSPPMRAIYSRLVAPCLLAPLSQDELGAMINYRCQLQKMPNPFTREAVAAIFLHTAGIPRRALILCSFALEWARLARHAQVEAEHVLGVVADLTIQQRTELEGVEA